MSAIERASEDIERGDYGMARTRLASRLRCQGYDPELLERLGQISFDMHDLTEAGRYWLASTVEGRHVDECIQSFVRRSGSDPKSVAARLPRAVIYTPFNMLPPIAQRRMDHLDLADEIGRPVAPGGREQATKVGRIVMAVLAAVGLVAVLLSLVVFVVGLSTVFEWLFG